MNKFEKLIEYIINDEDQKARELFHDIVVEKSRDIYESIMSEEDMEETVHGYETKDLTQEIAAEEQMGEGEGEEFDMDADDEEHGDEDHEEEFAAHADAEEAEHEEIEDKVMNIDAKLDELLAKFDEIMGDEGHGEMDHEEPEMGMDHEEPEMEDMGVMEAEEDSAQSGKSGKSGSAKMEAAKTGSAESGKSGSAKSGKSGKGSAEMMREYVDRIGEIYGGEGDANEGTPVGTGDKSGKVNVNTKPGSVGPGNDFGGEAVTSHGGNQDQDGTTPQKPHNEYNKGEGRLIGDVGNTPGGDKKLQSTGKEYSKEHEADGKLAGNDGKVAQNQKSVQKQNTGKK